MPRQDVPYGGAICRLRERIAEIFDLLGEKLHSINGVEGDGQGNILVRSDSSALSVTADQLQHEIVLDLDSSQLPAAAVSSVNGQTGAVALTADDIPSDNGDVQTDLDNLEAADTTLQGNINAEALARQNADSTLQNNINAALATIPGEVSSQIASNAAILQLQTDVLAIPNKVDKRTGTGKFAYTHDGATQGDIALVDGTTGATIPIRDANGRMHAADPASGATDKTVVNANWISQTGNSGPNNLIHKTGDETKQGLFTIRKINLKGVIVGSDSVGYCRAYVGVSASSSGELAMIAFMSGKGYNANDINNWAIMIFNARPTVLINRIIPVAQGTYQQAGAYAMTFDSEGKPEIWVKITVAGITNHRVMGQILMQTSAGQYSSDYFVEGDNAYYSEADFAAAYPDAVYSS